MFFTYRNPLLKNHCVFLGQNHSQISELKEITEKQIKNITGNDIIIPHKKGRNQEDENGDPMCNFECAMDSDDIEKCKIPTSLKCEICDSNIKKDCLYKKQWHDLNKYSWMGMHQFLGAKYVEKSFKDVDKDRCIVIDESFLGSIDKGDFTLSIPELQQFEKIMWYIWTDTKYPPMMEYCNLVINVIHALIEILKELIPDEPLKNIDLLQKLNTKLPNGLNHMRLILHHENKWYKVLNEEIKRYQKLMLSGELSITDWFTNMLPAIYGIVQIGYKNLNKKCKVDINLPFYTKYKIKPDKKGTLIEHRDMYYRNIDFKKLKENIPDVPIIILDATTDPKVYDLFAHKIDRELEVATEIDTMIPTPKRDIVQFEDGFYYKKSLGYEETRKRLFEFVLKIRQYEKQKDDNIKICAVITKAYEKKLDSFLKENGIYDIDLFHYGGLRGVNIIQNHNVMLLLGTSEPDIKGLQKDTGMWYIGDEIINIGRRPEKDDKNYYYTDDRLRMFVTTMRENEIEQCIDRLRFVLQEPGQRKRAYLITKLPISYKTQPTRIEYMKFKINGGLTPIDMRIIEVLKEKGELTAKQIYEYVKGTENDIRPRKDFLIKKGCIVIEKKKVGKYRPQEIHKINSEHPQVKNLTESGYFVSETPKINSNPNEMLKINSVLQNQ